MTPGPSLQELIQTAEAVSASDDSLDRLAAASRVAAEIEEVADAVLTHFVDQCRRDGRSWSEISGALGVTKQAAHKRFSFATPTMLERFTDRARSALTAAAAAATSLGHGYVGTEHLLVGLFGPADGIAAQVLGDAGITREEVEAGIVALVPRSPVKVTDPPFTPRATRSIERAVTEALSLGHNYVGTEHLLLALFADPEGFAATILVGLGAERDVFRAQIIQRLSGFTKPTS